MMFLEKGMYAIAAVVVVYFGAFEPDTADSVVIEAPGSASIKLASSSEQP